MRQWTAEERAKQAELIRQWQPWQLSTGATTKEGKAKASRNALKHGAYSADMREMMQALLEQKERLQEVSKVVVLERLANALDVKIIDFFTPAAAGEKKAKPLPSGRRPKK